jgi:hypothetical protein
MSITRSAQACPICKLEHGYHKMTCPNRGGSRVVGPRDMVQKYAPRTAVPVTDPMIERIADVLQEADDDWVERMQSNAVFERTDRDWSTYLANAVFTAIVPDPDLDWQTSVVRSIGADFLTLGSSSRHWVQFLNDRGYQIVPRPSQPDDTDSKDRA